MDENAQKEYITLIGNYSDAISGALADGFDRSVMARVGLATMSPSKTGLPAEMNMEAILSTGPLVGYYFAFYYYGITGKQISLNDYGKYIRPLNQYQTSLINGVLDKYDL